MKFAPVPDPFAGPAPVGPRVGAGLHDEALGRAAVAEHALAGALVAIKDRGARLVHTVQALTTPRALVVGSALAVGLGALVVYAVVRAARPPRALGLASLVSRSLAREIVGRVALGAAGTLGAGLAQSWLVPWIVATASRRAAKKPRRSRRRASPIVVPGEPRGPGVDAG